MKREQLLLANNLNSEHSGTVSALISEQSGTVSTLNSEQLGTVSALNSEHSGTMSSPSSMEEGDTALLSDVKIEIDVAEEYCDITGTHPYGMLNQQADYHCPKQEQGETCDTVQTLEGQGAVSTHSDTWLKQEATDQYRGKKHPDIKHSCNVWQ
ncbi:uncharacterized protein [Littorina saxatilis]|uniref:uncharacterized protein isoform X3 n=1 Tax=Littorina saxatilis TaxID=31220 RepID=UPI0038B6834A